MTITLHASWLVPLALAAALVPCDQRPRTPEHGEAVTTEEIECVRDADCTLMPILTCCGECPPEPPYQAITTAELDGLLIELEERCATDTRVCVEPVCAPPPRRCAPAAACVSGACVFVRVRCEEPRS